jgi:hypothetical protein
VFIILLGLTVRAAVMSYGDILCESFEWDGTTLTRSSTMTCLVVAFFAFGAVCIWLLSLPILVALELALTV